MTHESNNYTTIVDSETLAAHIHDDTWRVIDCRFQLGKPEAGEQAWRAGHIPGAVYADLERDLSGPPAPGAGRHPLPERAVLASCFDLWGIGGATQVVAYDDMGGAMASRLWWLLRWMGHTEVALLDGGIQAWEAAGQALSTSNVTPTPRRFPTAGMDRARVDAEDLLAGLNEQSLLLLDARDARRFRGEVEPLDKLAGHIPGAVNAPFMDNLDADKRFLPAEQLRARFEKLLGGYEPAATVHMCGSGVTACHNMLAMEIAGMPESRVYPPSWSGWIDDPSHPVTAGE